VPLPVHSTTALVDKPVVVRMPVGRLV
jgi:hypothetical protein